MTGESRRPRRGEIAFTLLWLGLIAFVAYRAVDNPAPFDYVTTVAAWCGGVAFVSVIAAVLRITRR